MKAALFQTASKILSCSVAIFLSCSGDSKLNDEETIFLELHTSDSIRQCLVQLLDSEILDPIQGNGNRGTVAVVYDSNAIAGRKYRLIRFTEYTSTYDSIEYNIEAFARDNGTESRLSNYGRTKDPRQCDLLADKIRRFFWK